MAEEDDSQKTEDPTAKKLSKAKGKGQTAVSQELKSWAIILAGTMMVITMAPALLRDVHDISFKFIHSPHAISVTPETMQFIMADALLDLGLAMAPIFTLLVIAAIIASLVQVGFLWSTDKITPKVSKISLKTGMKRMFSLRALVEFIKGIFKLSIVAIVAFGMSIPFLDDIAVFPSYSLMTFLDRLQEITIVMSVGALGVMTIIAMLDYAYQKYSFTQQMKMSKQEVKDEHKQAEGDPMIKRKIAQLRVDRVRQRMMAAVPDADVVVTNPTHFAVALKYSMEDMSAPRLVAKGVDHLAFRIREVAEDNEIPIVENAPLARALYASVELDEEIPTEHYKAVAEVIGYVMRMRGDLPQQAPANDTDP